MRRIIHIVRGVGPTSMPWNDLYYSLRCICPGVSHIPLQVGSVFGREVCSWKTCNDRCYRYISSSVVSSVLRVRAIYLRNEKKDVTSIIHIHNPSLFIVTLLIKLFCPNIKVVVNLHNDWRFFKPAQKIGLHFLIRAADRFVTVSYAIKSSIPPASSNKLIKNNELVSIPNGIRLSDFDNYDVKGRRERVMVIVARMVPQKNCFFAIDILAKSKSVEKLIWVGDGTQKHSILQYAKTLGVTARLDLRGIISREEVYKILSQSSIYIAPSKWEGIGVANLEAVALGCVPLLSDIPPHQEIAANIGIETYSLKNSEVWARKIDALLECPREQDLINRIAASRLVRDKYNLVSAVQDYINLYNEI
jgi:glycosyltransferase involved in cell wall biosynthesis